jgi:hypothetical protein
LQGLNFASCIWIKKYKDPSSVQLNTNSSGALTE